MTGYGHEVGHALARHPGIEHIRFTGSPSVGTLIQQVAAERYCLVTLELGGKSSQIMFADADLDAAIPSFVNAIVQSAGQTRSAGSRLLIDAAIYEPLLEGLGAAFERLRVDPAAMDLAVGPLIRQSQQQRVWDFLSDAQVAGISMVAQGQIVDEGPKGGFYQAPRLLRDVPVMHRHPVLNPDTGLSAEFAGGCMEGMEGEIRRSHLFGQHPAGPLFQGTRRGQRRAFPGRRRGRLHQRRLPRGRWRALRLRRAHGTGRAPSGAGRKVFPARAPGRQSMR